MLKACCVPLGSGNVGMAGERGSTDPLPSSISMEFWGIFAAISFAWRVNNSISYAVR
jgi:hypothetical protein